MSPPPGRALLRRSTRPADVAFGGAGLALTSLVLAVYGFWPGRTQVSLTNFHGAGMIACLRDQGIPTLVGWCESVGVPVGKPFLMGLPQIHVGWLVSHLPGVDPWAAHSIASGIFVVVGLVGAVWCGLRWTGSRWIGLACAGLYLLSPSVTGLNGFEFTFIGFVLLPAYVAAFLICLDAIDAGHRLGPGVGLVGTALLMAFTEGYSFVASALLVGCLAATRVVHPLTPDSGPAPRSRRPAVIGLVATVVALGLGAAAYRSYPPSGAYENVLEGLGAHRYLGLDVATLFIPVPGLLVHRIFGLTTEIPPFWGDGSNTSTNYLGFTVIGLVVWLLVAGRRQVSRRVRVELLALGIAGMVALVLSFGPSLKVHDEARRIVPEWDVPAEMTTMSLPTAPLHELPGLAEMRATFRWYLVTRFAAVMAAGVGIATLAPRLASMGVARPSLARSAALSVVLVVVVGTETLVDVPRQLDGRVVASARVDRVRAGPLPEAADLLEDDELVLFVPTVNDFLADAIAPLAGVRTFNVGGDKNYRLARAAWPGPVADAASAYGTDAAGDAYCRAMSSGVDAVVVTHFSLFQGALLRGTRLEPDTQMADAAAATAQDDRFEVSAGEWMTVLRPATQECRPS